MRVAILIIFFIPVASIGCDNKDKEAAPEAPAPEAPAPAAPAPAPLVAPEAPEAPAAPQPPPAAANPMMETQKAMEQAMGAMQAMNQMAAANNRQMGRPVNWRKLAPFLPAKVGDFEAVGELDGATRKMGAASHTEVKRRYKAGEKRLSLEIIDTSLVPVMRTPFAVAAMVQEDSTTGYRKGVKVAGHQALAEWDSKRKQSEIRVLAGGRFLVTLEIDDAEVGDAEKLAEKLDLKALSALKLEAQGEKAE